MVKKTAAHCEHLEHSGWTYLVADGIVVRRPVRLEGINVNAAADADSVTLYHGLDSGSGRIIGTFKALAALSLLQNFLPPLPCPNGIYAVFNATCSNVTILWSVIAEPEE